MAKNAVFNAILAEYWLYKPSGNKYGQKSGTAGDEKSRVGHWSTLLFSFLALLTQTESLNDCAVALNVSLLEVVEQSATLTYQLGQCPFSAIILTVLLKMFRQMGNTV